MTTFERIKNLADNQKISLQKVAIDIGLSENAIYGWKTRKPKGEDLAKIADYFHVSVDYLLGREEIDGPQFFLLNFLKQLIMQKVIQVNQWMIMIRK